MKKQANIVVVGSINMDLVVKTANIPIPGETVMGETFTMIPGGKGANQAVAAARLKGNVSLIGCVGDDVFGIQMLEQLRSEEIDTTYVNVMSGTPTGVALIQVGGDGDNSIVVVPGANSHLSPEHIDLATEMISRADVLLVQLEIPMDTVTRAVELAHTNGVIVILNPAPAAKLSPELLKYVDILTPNETEASLLATGSLSYTGEIEHNIQLIKESMEKGDIIVTRGSHGVYCSIKGKVETYPAHRVTVTDTTAAGDSFNAGIATLLGEGVTLTEAILFALKVGAITVTRFGAQSSLPTREEVEHFSF